jgi:hypothetical protein
MLYWLSGRIDQCKKHKATGFMPDHLKKDGLITLFNPLTRKILSIFAISHDEPKPVMS